MQSLIDALRAAGVAERAAGRRGAVSRTTFDGAPPLDDPLGQLGYAVHPFLARINQTRGAVGARSSATSPRPTR